MALTNIWQSFTSLFTNRIKSILKIFLTSSSNYEIILSLRNSYKVFEVLTVCIRRNVISTSRLPVTVKKQRKAQTKPRIIV